MGNRNLGTLFVRLNAESKKFAKDMSSATEAVEKFAKETKKLANDVAQFSGALMAIGGAAVAMAAQVDRRAAGSLLRLKESLQLVAIQVSDLLEPALRSLTSTFRTVAQYVAGLDPEVKKQVGTWAVYAAQLAVASKALGAVAGLADAAFGALSYGFKVLAGVGLGPILGIVSALAAVAAIVIFVHRAWRKNWGDIQGITEQVFNAIGDAVKWLSDLFKSMWDFIIDGAERTTMALLEVVEKIAKLAGKDLNLDGLREGFRGTFKDLKSGDFIKEGLKFVKQVGEDVGTVVAEEVKIIVQEVRDALGIKELKKGTPRGRQIVNKDEERAFGDYLDQWFRDMDAERAAKQREQRQLFDASIKSYDEEKKARAQLAAKIAFDARMEQAGRTGDLSGLSSGEKRLVTKDPGGAWGELNKAQQNVKNLARRLGSMVKDSFGALSSTINSISQGAQAGGVWGALIAAVMEIFNRMKSFQRLLSFFEQGLVRLGEFLEPLVGPIFDLIAQGHAFATEGLLPLFKALQPLFDGLMKLLKKIFEPMAIVNDLISALAPVLEIIGTVIGGIFEALGPLLDLGTGVVKVFASALIGFLIVLNEIAAALGDEKARAESVRLGAMIDRMWSPTAGNSAAADAAAAAASWDLALANKAAADSARDVSEELTNVPSGYKLDLARYNATNGGYEAAMGGGGSGGGFTVNGDVIVSTEFGTPAEIAEEMKKERARERASRRGNPADPRD